MNNETLNALLVQALPALGGVLLGYMWNKARGLTEQRDNLYSAMRVILKIELRRIHADSVRDGYISYDDEAFAEEVYARYHGLGGNGQGTHLIETIRHLPVRDKP